MKKQSGLVVNRLKAVVPHNIYGAGWLSGDLKESVNT
jgi:hypothetical protein